MEGLGGKLSPGTWEYRLLTSDDILPIGPSALEVPSEKTFFEWI